MHLKFYKGENFTDSFLHHIFESENLRLSFFYENIITCGERAVEWNVKNETVENCRVFISPEYP